MNARGRAVHWLIAGMLIGMVAASPAQAAFGVKNVSATAVNEDGTLDFQSGSHPYEYKVEVGMNVDASGQPEGTLRKVVVNLAPGVVGNAVAVPLCSREDFEGFTSRCPGSTQVGIVLVKTKGLTSIDPVYNVEPPPGVPAELGFSLNEKTSLQNAFVRTGGDYGVSISDGTLPDLPIQSIAESIWGVPASPAHDAERECIVGGVAIKGCSSGTAEVPFITLPTSCSEPLVTSVEAESVENPGVLTAPVDGLSQDSGGNPMGLVGCDRLPFAASIETRPETSTSDSSTGLQVHVHIPQNEGPSQLASAQLRDVTVALPTGLAVNPSSADGLQACGPGEIALSDPGPPSCPPASKVGTVEIVTPLIDHPLPGAVYLARQGENPFNALLALYVTVSDPLTGVVVKLAGRIDPNPVTGQLSASFVANPQLPFEDLRVNFFGGPRGTLTTPPVCGQYETHAALTPWSSPQGRDADPITSFSIDNSPIAGSCPAQEVQMPDAPGFDAGTASAVAGTYSPFALQVSRENGSQRFGRIDTTLPKGVLGRLAGVSYCPDAAISASNGTAGRQEQSNPSCPLDSEVGIVNVGAGSGNQLYVAGHAYLAGPYKGAPVSLEIVTPAVAGPFDLGTVSVRTALYVNEASAQIHAVSDPLPTILDGIPLDIRTITLNVSRTQFTLNPTNCNPATVAGALTSTVGQVVNVTTPFQVGGCSGLAFSPQFKLSFSGQTKRAGFPIVKAVLTQPRGSNANIAGTSVILPKGMLIANAHISNPCTRVEFNATDVPGEACPRKSVLGTAKVWTPLLEKPEQGKVYFRSNGGERELPDLVVALRGQIPLQLVGFIDSVGRKGAEVRRVRTRFQSVPDAPFSRFELKLSGGKKGLLQNSRNLCKASNSASVKLTGQNGKTHDTEAKVQVKCKKAGVRGRSQR
jgi:hypothetical protein